MGSELPTNPLVLQPQLQPGNDVALPRPRVRPRDRGRAKPEKQPRKWKRIIKRSGLVLGAVVLVGGLVFGYMFYKNISKLTGNNNPLALLGAFHPSPLKNQNGRVNILVAGNSADDPGHNGANLTDSIMVLSIDTHNNTAFMLSIPRDLWIYNPALGYNTKINDVYPYGGMNMLQRVVESNFGITIDYQALVNYGAFRDLVNAVGGITITINSPDPRGIYDPSLDYTTRYCCALAKYPNGPVHLNGKQALNLARARGDAYGSYGFNGDFTRTKYQREMIMAVKAKAAQSNVIANPLKITKLIDAVGKNVKTNLSVGEIESLYYYSKKVNQNAIQSYNINSLEGKNTTMLKSYLAPNGEDALIPTAGLGDFSQIQTQIKRLVSSDPLVREQADVVLLNATNTNGLAGKQESKLVARGVNVSLVADAPKLQSESTIIDNSGGKKPNTLAALKKMYSATVVKNAALTAKYPGTDFIVLLGSNVAGATASAQ